METVDERIHFPIIHCASPQEGVSCCDSPLQTFRLLKTSLYLLLQ